MTYPVVIARESGRSSNRRHVNQIRDVAAYWMPRFRGA
jgi:hypothetical protein